METNMKISLTENRVPRKWMAIAILSGLVIPVLILLGSSPQLAFWQHYTVADGIVQQAYVTQDGIYYGSNSPNNHQNITVKFQAAEGRPITATQRYTYPTPIWPAKLNSHVKVYYKPGQPYIITVPLAWTQEIIEAVFPGLAAFALILGVAQQGARLKSLNRPVSFRKQT